MATGQQLSVRRVLLSRIGISSAQRKALMKGRPIVLETAWLQSHFREHNHAAFPPDFSAADAWELQSDGNTLVPVA